MVPRRLCELQYVGQVPPFWMPTNTGKINISTRRVLRGGSFDYQASNVRSAYRNGNQPDYRNNS